MPRHYHGNAHLTLEKSNINNNNTIDEYNHNK